MNKHLCCTLVSATAFTLVAGCGGTNTDNTTSTPAAAAKGTSGTVQQINGAGATFPYPIYSKWFAEYGTHHPDVRINYQSIGSGGGIQQVISQTVAFGASDSPMTDDQLKAAPGPILHFPTVLGAGLQPAGHRRAEIHRATPRRHLPRQDHEME